METIIQPNKAPYIISKEASRLFKLAEAAELTRVRVSNIKIYQHGYSYEKALKRCGIGFRAGNRARRRYTAFWKYLKDNNLDLRCI